MNNIYVITYILAGVSVLLFVCVIFLYLSLKKSKSKIEELEFRFKANPSYEQQQFLADLLRGNALFLITRIAPEDVLLRRS